MFVASATDCFDPPLVGNGASDLFVGVFGEAAATPEVTVIAKLKG